jgi:hypothetical protein
LNVPLPCHRDPRISSTHPQPLPIATLIRRIHTAMMFNRRVLNVCP